MASFLISSDSTWPSRLNDEVQALIDAKFLEISASSLWRISSFKDTLTLKHPLFPTMISLDIEKDAHYRRKVPSTSKDPLLRALGYKKTEPLKVLDACGGFGRDAVFMAQQSIQVFSFERHPLLYLLFRDALLRFPVANLNWTFGSSLSEIQSNSKDSQVLYLDPMFTAEKKSSLPQKEIQYFKELLKDESDSDELFTAALKANFDRIIVKRSDKGSFLSDLKPVNSWTGTSVRFDLYKPKGELWDS